MNISRLLIVVASAVSINSIAFGATLVVPEKLTATPGSGGQLPFRGDQLRYQNIYYAENFLPASGLPMVITRVSFRVDEATLAGASAIIPDLEVRMGTASSSAPASTLEYTRNIGADYKTVFRGQWKYTPSGEGDTVHPFSMTLQLSEPFYYDPRNGGLNLDLFVHKGGDGTLVDADGSADFGFATSGPLTASRGFSFVPPLVTQFGFQSVPEPSVVRLGSLIGTLLVGTRKRWK